MTDVSMCDEIVQAQRELEGEFGLFDDWMGRYEYLIDLGRHLPEFPSEWKTEANKIHGCQSQVWLRTQMQNGRLRINGASDAAIVSGLIAVLLRVFSDRKPGDVLATKPDFIASIGFDQHLSPTRSNGLHAMIEAIYQRAREAAGEH